MGELNIHNLSTYIDKYGCTNFIETGSGIGTGIAYACHFPFKTIVSIEIMSQLFEKCSEIFKGNDKVKLINNNSVDGLNQALGMISDDPCLFWLDAHFPGADFHFNSYDHLKDIPDLHKPLRKELAILKEKRSHCKDVMIIDDLQIYEDGPFELKDDSFRAKYGENGIEFITELFGESHDFTRNYRHQGFLILTPKNGK